MAEVKAQLLENYTDATRGATEQRRSWGWVGVALGVPDGLSRLLQIGHGLIYSGDGKLFDKDRYQIHAEVHEDRDFGREAVDQADDQRSDQFAREVDPAHLRIQC